MQIEFGKGDAYLGSTVIAGILSLIPGLREALQLMLLIVGIFSALASTYYYVTAARKLKEKEEQE